MTAIIAGMVIALVASEISRNPVNDATFEIADTSSSVTMNTYDECISICLGEGDECRAKCAVWLRVFCYPKCALDKFVCYNVCSQDRSRVR